MIRFFLLNLLFVSFFLNNPVMAHGGEEHVHEEKKTPLIENNLTQTSIFWEKKSEILIKYSAPYPEVETNIQVFLTDRETNKSLSDVLVSLEVEGRKMEFPETSINGLYQQKVKFLQSGLSQIKGSIKGEKINDQFSFMIEITEKKELKSKPQKKIVLLWISFLGLLLYLIYLLKNEKIQNQDQKK